MLFEQIAKNKRKTVILIFGFFLFTAIVGAALGYYLMGSLAAGVLIATVAGGVYALYTIGQSTDIVMSMNHAHEVTQVDQAPELWHIIEDMAMLARVPMPRVFIIDDASPNAFATGNKPENAAVAATTGILASLNREELEGVMAHEMSHVRNYDIRVQTLAVALTSVITMLANFGTSFWGWSARDNDRQTNIFGIFISIGVMLLAPLAATIIQMAISRNREYLADAGAVELTRNPQGLIQALTKISRAEPMDPENIAPSSAGLYIGDPLKQESRMSHLFDTHPPMEKRIEALQHM